MEVSSIAEHRPRLCSLEVNHARMRIVPASPLEQTVGDSPLLTYLPACFLGLPSIGGGTLGRMAIVGFNRHGYR